jgi:hypothetical protein
MHLHMKSVLNHFLFPFNFLMSALFGEVIQEERHSDNQSKLQCNDDR